MKEQVEKAPDVEGVMILLYVPAGWKRLPVPEIARRLRAQEPALTNMLANEVKRWAGSGAVNLSALQQFLDDRTGKNDKPAVQS